MSRTTKIVVKCQAVMPNTLACRVKFHTILPITICIGCQPCGRRTCTPDTHIDECVSPERRNKYQDEPGGIIAFVGRSVDTDDPENVSYKLPESTHSDDPGISFPVENALDDVGNEC